jgi:hypothetical protein
MLIHIRIAFGDIAELIFVSLSNICCSRDEHSQSAHKNELIDVIYLSKQ